MRKPDIIHTWSKKSAGHLLISRAHINGHILAVVEIIVPLYEEPTGDLKNNLEEKAAELVMFTAISVIQIKEVPPKSI